MEEEKALIKENKNELLKAISKMDVVRWSIEHGVNKRLSFEDFKDCLLEIGIVYKKLKHYPNAQQVYNGDHEEIRIYGISKTTRDQLITISKNLGIKLSDMLKPKLREIIQSYPDHLKVHRDLDQ